MRVEFNDERTNIPIIKIVIVVFCVLFFVYGCSVVFNIVTLPFQAVQGTVQTTKTVIQRITNADTMLNNYRWFKDAHYKLQTFPAQIALAKTNLDYAEKHTPDYVANRMTEYTGIQQVCMDLVGQYNSRSERMDSGFLRNPEQWLPVGTYMPLPENYDVNYCNGEHPLK